MLVGYGFAPTLQPPDSFGRIYAVYGGFFIVLSYLWGWAVDKDRPDLGGSLTLLPFGSLGSWTQPAWADPGDA